MVSLISCHIWTVPVMSSSSSKLTCELLVILFLGKHSKTPEISALVVVAMVTGCKTIVLDGLHTYVHTHTYTHTHVHTHMYTHTCTHRQAATANSWTPCFQALTKHQRFEGRFMAERNMTDVIYFAPVLRLCTLATSRSDQWDSSYGGAQLMWGLDSNVSLLGPGNEASSKHEVMCLRYLTDSCVDRVILTFATCECLTDVRGRCGVSFSHIWKYLW